MTTRISNLAAYNKLIKKFPNRLRALYIGDSWFQYPLRKYADLQTLIDTEFNLKMLGIDDSIPGRDADEVFGLIERWEGVAQDLKSMGKPFNLICLSLGGNDVIGNDFGRHLFKPPVAPQVPNWPYSDTIPEICKTHFDFDALNKTFNKVREAYQLIIQMRNRCAPDAPIITHSYADVTPTNTPYKFLGFRSGPWLWGELNRVGIRKQATQREVSRWLLASFAKLMDELQRNNRQFFLLDTRQELPNFEGWWDNEIHPLGNGFRLLAKKHWIPKIRTELGLS